MTGRCVVLGDGRRVALGAYTAAWRSCLAMEPGASVSRSCGSRWPSTAREVLAEFRAGMHDRINRHLPGYGVGRKWESDWQRECIQAAGRLNTPRLCVGWLPMWLRPRFANRIASE